MGASTVQLYAEELPVPQVAAKQLHLVGWELTVPVDPGAVVPQKSSRRGACPCLLELSTGFSLWGSTCHQSKWGKKMVHEEEAGARDAQSPTCPHHASFACVSVGTNLISLGLGALLAF